MCCESLGTGRHACVHNRGEKGKKTCRESRRDVEVKALVKTLPYRLAELKTKKVRTH